LRIAAEYSHLNGREFLMVHRPQLIEEILAVVEGVDAERCRTKLSRERRKEGRVLFSPEGMNSEFQVRLREFGWRESRVNYWVTKDTQLIRRTMALPPAEQKAMLDEAGADAFPSYNQTDFVKERTAIEVQFGKYAFVAYDLFVKHLAFYVGDTIDVGVEILPMKELQEEMSSGVGYYEGQIYNVIRQGRGVPAVPLWIIGVAP
jgi:hypothetical protein